MNSSLSKIVFKTAAEVCQRYQPGDQARALLRDGATPAQFVDALSQKQLLPDALQFLSQALPKREAVWWACQCLRGVAGTAPAAKATAAPAAAALAVAEKWCADPSEENRRAAQKAADDAGLDTAAGCAAAAAFWSGGSLSRPELPAVPPADNLTGLGVAGAVMLAAVLGEPAKIPEKYRQFLGLGLEIAAGTRRWKEVPSKGAPPAPTSGKK